jgi:hypothetical protein
LQHFDKIALRQKGPRGDLPLKQRLENSRVGTIAKALARCCSGGPVGLIFVLSHFFASASEISKQDSETLPFVHILEYRIAGYQFTRAA